MADKNENIDWETLAMRIRRGKVIPILGDRVGHDGFLTSDELIQRWAKEVGYPWTKTRNITRVAQYCSVTKDPFITKEIYLEFLKQHLLNKAKKQPDARADLIADVEDEFYELSFSEVAEKLNYPNFDATEEDEMNPLTILAGLNVPLYITTNYHSFIKRALNKVNKRNYTIEICPWYPDASEKTSILDSEDYRPNSQEPVVYFLHGEDSIPDSLVLTENDYLEYLVKTSEESAVIPLGLRKAMSSSALLLLGYELQDWDFRVLFRGLIQSTFTVRRPPSVCIQLDPNGNNGDNISKIENYLKKYFKKYNFDIYWGDINSFTKDLRHRLGDES